MWGSLSTGQQILVLLGLRGGPAYRAEMIASARATGALGASTRKLGEAQVFSTRRTFLQQQSLFTLRRYAFYATLAVTGLVFAVARLGFQYYNALQTARVALQPLFRDTPGALDAILDRLYRIAALSPFLYKDVTVAFRNMYPAFRLAGLSAGLTVQTIQSITNAMSLAGRTAPGQLNRVSVALQHMALMGRPLGFTVTQLDRLGVPFTSALRAKFHFTAQQLHSIATTGITAKQAIQALNEFIARTPGYAGAAARQANQTLTGSWAQFKDILGQAAARGEGGLFGRLHNILIGVNTELAPLFMRGEPITLTRIAEALDRQLTPRSHVFINTFIILQNVLRTVVAEFFLLFKAISYLFLPLDYLGSLFGVNRLAAKLFGIVLGTLIFLLTLARLRIMALREAEMLLIFTGNMVIKAERAWILIQKIWTYSMIFSREMIKSMIPILQEAAIATWEWTAALLANPITWLVIGVLALTVGLTYLYFRWARFHRFVDTTWHWIDAHWYMLEGTILGPFLVLYKVIGLLNDLRVSVKNTVDYINQQWSNLKHPFHGGRIHGPARFAPAFLRLTGMGLATGGIVTSGGAFTVGERGRELVTLPRGSAVTPLDSVKTTLSIKIIPQGIFLEGKKIGQVLAEVVTDSEART